MTRAFGFPRISRRTVAAGLPLLAIVSLAVMLMVQHRADGSACDKTYVGTAGGNWEVDGNWSPFGTPTSSEKACSLDLIVYNGAPGNVGVVDLQGGLTSNGNLHLVNTTETSRIVGLTMNGTLTVDGTLELEGSNSAADMTGNGTVVAKAGSALDIAHASTINPSSGSLTLRNEGLLNILGLFGVQNGGKVQNADTMNVSGANSLISISASATVVNESSGTINLPDDNYNIEPKFENDGTVNFTHNLSLLQPNAVDDDAGQYATTNSTDTLRVLSARSFSDPTPLTGPGAMVVDFGAVDFTTPASIGHVRYEAGSATGDLTVTNNLELGKTNSDGEIFALDGGSTTLASTATVSIAAEDQPRLRNGHHFVNQATFSFPASGNLSICDAGSQLINDATITQAAGATVSCNDSGHSVGKVVNNASKTITVSGLTLDLQVDLDNAGTINVTNGTLKARGGTHTGTTTVTNTGDKLDVGAGGTPATFSGTAAVSGNGLLVARSVVWGSSASISRVQVAGSLGGTATITGSLDLEGSLVGPGTITIDTGATAAVDSTTAIMRLDNSVALVNNGTMTQTQFLGICSSTITNNATWNAANIVGPVTPSFPVCTGGSVTNSATGSILPTASFEVQVPFTNAGTLNVPSSTLVRVPGGSSSGSITGAGQLSVTNGSNTFDIGSSTITGPVVTVEGGTLVSSGATVRILILQADGPTARATSRGSLTVTQQLDSASGQLAGAGTTTLGSGASLTFSGLGGRFLEVVDNHELIIDGSVTLDGFVTFIALTDSIQLCNSSTLTVNGTLNIGAGQVGNCGGAASTMHVTSGGTLHGQQAACACAPVSDVLVPTTNDGSITVAASVAFEMAQLTNNGSLTAASGSSVQTSNLTNLSGGSLESGTYDLSGNLRINGAPDIVTNKADLAVRAGGSITDTSSVDRLKITSNNAGAHLLLGVPHNVSILVNSGNLDVGSTLTASSGLIQFGGRTTLLSGSINKAQFLGGRLEGNGSVPNLKLFQATVAPSNPGSSSFGTISATTLTMASNTTYEADLDIACSTCGDKLTASTVSVAGTLALNGQGPAGSVARVVSASTRTGTFSTVTGTFIPPATTLGVTYTPNFVEVFTAPPPVIDISGSGGSEGSGGGTTTRTVQIQLSWAYTSPISVDVTTHDNTATAPSDYTSHTETVTFLAGETTKYVDIDVKADNAFEADEDFTVGLSNAVGSATIGTSSTTINVDNDDILGPSVFTDGVDTNPGDGNCDDGTGECTLRGAIQEANALPGQQTISVAPGTYTLSIAGRDEDSGATGDLDITDDVDLSGSSAIVDADGIDRVFDIRSGTVTLSGLTLVNGSATEIGTDPGKGGGLLIRAGTTPTLFSLTASDNSAQHGGGGLATLASVTTSNLTMQDNTAEQGGGFYAEGAVTVTLTTPYFDGNDAGDGGGSYTRGGAVVTMTSPTMTNNTATGFGGGAVGAFGGSLTFNGANIVGNSAAAGGGMAVVGNTTLSLTAGLVANNTSSDASNGGAGILVSGADAQITSTTITGNTTPGPGGGVLLAGGTTTITTSTVSGNSGNVGGGIVTAFGTTTVTQSTLTGNTATFFGGAIANASTLTLQNSTITGNTAPVGAGLANYHDNTTPVHGIATVHSVTFGANTGASISNFAGASTTVTNSIFVTPIGGSAPCNGAPSTSGDYNVTPDASCGFSQPNDLIGDVELGTLANHGGPTETQVPEFWAIDTSNACLATDQRGVARPQGLGCDRGAVEQ